MDTELLTNLGDQITRTLQTAWPGASITSMAKVAGHQTVFMPDYPGEDGLLKDRIRADFEIKFGASPLGGRLTCFLPLAWLRGKGLPNVVGWPMDLVFFWRADDDDYSVPHSPTIGETVRSDDPH